MYSSWILPWSDLPSTLQNIPHPPSHIFLQGSEKAKNLFHHLPERGLAVVGTRQPTDAIQNNLHQWMLELKGAQLIILSGLARGIDTLAHTLALKAHLPTIAILGTGLDIPYPVGNQALRQKILEADGLLISEFPPGTPGKKHHFLQRNRLIAGWSKATWIVQAGRPSGALNTARWARDLQQTCFAVPCSPQAPHFEGNQALLDQEHALCFWGVHSLGAVWLELSSFPQKHLISVQSSPSTT